MCEKCSREQQKIYNVHPKERLQVGYLDGNASILVSEGVNTLKIYYSLWMPIGQGRTWEIDTVTQNADGTWDYRRVFRCDNLECLTRTFLTLVNPAAKFISGYVPRGC